VRSFGASPASLFRSHLRPLFCAIVAAAPRDISRAMVVIPDPLPIVMRAYATAA
jgi:hypothetical protein